MRGFEPVSSTGGCGISHVLPGDQWLPAVTPHQGRPCHLLPPTDRCSPDSRPALLCRVSGLACGYFCTQTRVQHMLWWEQVTLVLVAANAGFLAILEQREIGARPVPERRLPVKLVSWCYCTRRLGLAPVSPHSEQEAPGRAESPPPEKLE